MVLPDLQNKERFILRKTTWTPHTCSARIVVALHLALVCVPGTWLAAFVRGWLRCDVLAVDRCSKAGCAHLVMRAGAGAKPNASNPVVILITLCASYVWTKGPQKMEPNRDKTGGKGNKSGGEIGKR